MSVYHSTRPSGVGHSGIAPRERQQPCETSHLGVFSRTFAHKKGKNCLPTLHTEGRTESFGDHRPTISTEMSDLLLYLLNKLPLRYTELYSLSPRLFSTTTSNPLYYYCNFLHKAPRESPASLRHSLGVPSGYTLGVLTDDGVYPGSAFRPVFPNGGAAPHQEKRVDTRSRQLMLQQ